MDIHQAHADQIARLAARSNAALNHGRSVEVNVCYNAFCAIAEECARECGDASPYADPTTRPQPYYPGRAPTLLEMLANAFRWRRAKADTSEDAGEHAGAPAPSSASITHN